MILENNRITVEPMVIDLQLLISPSFRIIRLGYQDCPAVPQRIWNRTGNQPEAEDLCQQGKLRVFFNKVTQSNPIWPRSGGFTHLFQVLFNVFFSNQGLKHGVISLRMRRKILKAPNSPAVTHLDSNVVWTVPDGIWHCRVSVLSKIILANLLLCK